jgi:hypothetical protein
LKAALGSEHDPRSAAAVVAKLGGRRLEGLYRIISDNHNHQDEKVAADQIEIIGRVICGFKRY